MEDKQFVRKLNLLFAFSKGAETRRLIINTLKERPRNANQLAVALNYNYRTIKHHTNILKKEEMISEITQDRYNKVFILSALLASRMDLLASIFNSEQSMQARTPALNDKSLYQGLFNGINVGIIVTDNGNRVLKTNPEVSRIFGVPGTDENDSNSQVLNDSIFGDKNIINLLQKKGSVDNYAKEIIDEGGNRHFVLISVSDIQGDSGNSIGRCYLIHDIVNYAMATGARGQKIGVSIANPGLDVAHMASATAIPD
jgi:PAS domain S-box-containing protein